MSLGVSWYPIPVGELDEEGVACAECGARLEDEAFPVDADYYCAECIEELIKDLEEKAIKGAEEKCKITGPLPKYDPKKEFRCTPEDYESGMRESYTPNSYMALCRHKYTNYDELIKNLDRDSLSDEIWYFAVRQRIEELLAERIDEEDFEPELEGEDL